MVVDPARWGRDDRHRPEMVDTLQDAVVRRRRTRLTYEDAKRHRSERLVDPWGLVDKDGDWYLVAGTDKGRRTFRVDRVVAVEVTEESAERPGDLDLSREWEEVVGEMERRRSLVEATVLVPERHAHVLRHQFGRHCTTVGVEDDGRVRLQVAAPMALSIAETLAGWGAGVEVLGPDSVKTELARIGAELVAAHGPERARGAPRSTRPRCT